MQRRTFFNKGFWLGLGLSQMGRLAIRNPFKSKIPGAFVHVVLFWLKPTTHIEAFKADAVKLMEDIDEVVTYHVGEPAGTPRSVVDNSYSVCLIATFNSKEAQDAYQVHPIHKAYVENNNHLWDKVQIYDSLTKSH